MDDHRYSSNRLYYVIGLRVREPQIENRCIRPPTPFLSPISQQPVLRTISRRQPSQPSSSLYLYHDRRVQRDEIIVVEQLAPFGAPTIISSTSTGNGPNRPAPATPNSTARHIYFGFRLLSRAPTSPALVRQVDFASCVFPLPSPSRTFYVFAAALPSLVLLTS